MDDGARLPTPVVTVLRGLLTWWFLAGVVAWPLVAPAGGAAQVAVLFLGALAGVVQAQRAGTRPGPALPRVEVGADVPAVRIVHGVGEELALVERRAADLRALLDPGVEVVILVAHHARLVAVRRSEIGLDLELDAHQASYVLKSGDGDVVRATTGGPQTMSVLVPRRLLDTVEGERFEACTAAWQHDAAPVDVEWEVGLDGSILYVQVRRDGDEVRLGTIA